MRNYLHTQLSDTIAGACLRERWETCGLCWTAMRVWGAWWCGGAASTPPLPGETSGSLAWAGDGSRSQSGGGSNRPPPPSPPSYCTTNHGNVFVFTEQMYFGPALQYMAFVKCRVSFGSGSCFGIRIRIQEGKNDPQK